MYQKEVRKEFRRVIPSTSICNLLFLHSFSCRSTLGFRFGKIIYFYFYSLLIFFDSFFCEGLTRGSVTGVEGGSPTSRVSVMQVRAIGFRIRSAIWPDPDPAIQVKTYLDLWFFLGRIRIQTKIGSRNMKTFYDFFSIRNCCLFHFLTVFTETGSRSRQKTPDPNPKPCIKAYQLQTKIR